VAQKFHFENLQIEVTRASRGLCAIAELLLKFITFYSSSFTFIVCTNSAYFGE